MEEKITNEEVKEVNGGYDSYGGDRCPKCGSSNVKFLGFIASGEIANFRCQNCGHYWEEIA